ncbi:MAG TPA: c-type cytochrome [Thermoanaerobaculia bacterium]|nr:c-type cytochrome [Thermoanaerobaculia bacterium]
MKRLTFLLLFALACNRAETPQQSTAPDAAPADPKIARGRQLVVQYGCTVCHVIPTIDGDHGALGPSLAGVATRPTISMGVVQNTPANLAQYVQDPASLNPQSTMPPIGLNDADADAIASFLLTLK